MLYGGRFHVYGNGLSGGAEKNAGNLTRLVQRELHVDARIRKLNRETHQAVWAIRAENGFADVLRLAEFL